MNFVNFYKQQVSENISADLKKNLEKMSDMINEHKDKKCFMFAITKKNHLLSFKYTNSSVAISELKKGNKIVLISALHPILNAIGKQIIVSLKGVKVDKEREFWIFHK